MFDPPLINRERTSLKRPSVDGVLVSTVNDSFQDNSIHFPSTGLEIILKEMSCGRLNASWKISSSAVDGQSFLVIARQFYFLFQKENRNRAHINIDTITARRLFPLLRRALTGDRKPRDAYVR